MLTDNEAQSDYLNFAGVAKAAADLVANADGRPISVGISGTWGIGKTSLLRLTQATLAETPAPEGKRFEFVEFNAWLYQDFDDARTALLDVIASKLAELAEREKGALSKVQEFSRRINWLRIARLAATGAASLALNAAAPGSLGVVLAAAQALKQAPDSEALQQANKAVDAVAAEARSLIREPAQQTPSEEISALRESFKAALSELGIVLVVFVDDLDRCLPPTTIGTLEAIRLLLFMDNTAFVVAADDEMVRFAVRRHFEGLPNDAAAINYFDKLIQVPIRVPPLGTQEVRAYLMLLALEDSGRLDADHLETAREALQERLRNTWRGEVVDRSVVEGSLEGMEDLKRRLDMVLRLAPLMTRAPSIQGNPRLIKRFMVALSIRRSMAAAHGVEVDETVLAKLLLFERLGFNSAYSALVSAVTSSGTGIFAGISDLQDRAAAGADLEFPWSDPSLRDWLTIEPSFAGVDLRGALYVGRETTRVVQPDEQLTARAQELLAGLLAAPREATTMGKSAFEALNEAERQGILTGLLDAASAVEVWGAPPLLIPLKELAKYSGAAREQLITFLCTRPPTHLTPAVVPALREESWAPRVFEKWQTTEDLPQAVRRAIDEGEN